ncbi:MAG: hypothetical protein WCA77_05265 [Thermoplasmata archaeon]
MVGSHRWFLTVKALAAVLLVLLFVQYLLGLWTNLYAPSMFTSNSSSPALDWHYNVGFILFFTSILLVILTAFTREIRLIAPAVFLLIAVLVAGLAGGAFVGSSPNNPLDSLLMAVMFLVAFAAALRIGFYNRSRTTIIPLPPATASPPASSS